MNWKTVIKAWATALFCSQPVVANPITLEEFVDLIPLWEVPKNSSPYVIGDNGKAYGYYQIHEVMVQDYNRITGANAVHEDAFDPDFSRHLAYTVLDHYKKHMERYVKKVTTDHLLYVWNGGGGAWIRVAHPSPDLKQRNLERYAARANKIIRWYVNKRS